MFLGDTNCPIIIPDNPIRNLVDIEKSIQKKFRLTLWAPFIKALKEFQLVQENDKIAVAISGGKDSLLLAKLFHELKRASNINFEVVFIAMNPGFNKRNLYNLKFNICNHIKFLESLCYLLSYYWWLWKLWLMLFIILIFIF